jgi:lysophospholipase L1-like esterase
MKCFAFVLVLCLAVVSASAEEFALKDRDTLVFLGDSITAEGTYGKIVETYTLLRFPKLNVRFINAGWGGDTAAGGLKRLQRDVFDRGATVVTVAYGINDIGWGGKADDEHRKLYLDSIRGIVEQCKQHNVRVFICSAAVTATDPDKSENDYLQKMCDDGMAISKSLDQGAIDIQRTMREIQRRIKAANAKERDSKKHETLHAADGIHLNELGQTAMAFAILKGVNAPADVSSVTVNAEDAKLEAHRGCEITSIKGDKDGLEFDRLDQGLPLNFGAFGAFRYRFIPIPEEINRYMLTVKSLKPGKYDIKVDERAIGAFSADDLNQGVNLCSATVSGWDPGGPWEAQAWLLNDLVKARFQAISTERAYSDYLKHHPQREELKLNTDAVNEKLEQLERKMAQPQTYHFVIRPASSKAS